MGLILFQIYIPKPYHICKVVNATPDTQLSALPQINEPPEAIKENINITYYNIPLSKDVQEYTTEVCKRYDVDPKMVYAIIQIESNFKSNVVSSTNDYGLMQINQYNHQWLSETLEITDFLDECSNIHAGVYMLKEASKYATDTHGILMVYNLGIVKARRLWENGCTSTEYSDKVVQAMNELIELK